mmetsp:Transcript_43932/g.102727  ORF Transcript_43932/g.102727 Transcript_43932/m.102727 type:complete len:86 (+) Transcript_43932:1088-1345(+)
MLYIAQNNEGSKVHISVRDNAAIGKNAEYVGAFGAELCDRKWFDANICLFWYEEHGKCDVDKLFGAIEWMLGHWNCFSQDQVRRR